MPLGLDSRNGLATLQVWSMSNLYSITKNQDAIRRLFRVTHDSAGNMPPMPGVFPDYPAPVVRTADGERELIMMRWDTPPPAKFGARPSPIFARPLPGTGGAG